MVIMINMASWQPALVLFSACFSITQSTLKGPFDVCEREVFNTSCSNGDVIMMRSALYGRMDVGRCIRSNVGTRNCDTDVFPIIDSLCSGLPSCSVKGAYSALLDIKPCPDHAAFLRATYECLPVVSSPSMTCDADHVVSRDSGYFASSTRSDYGPGSAHCPWRIEPGTNRINITLLKFTPSPRSPLASSSAVCFEIGTFQDGGVPRGILTCGSDPREKVIHVTSGSEVRLHFKDKSFLEELGHFLIRFKPVGCSAPPEIKYASFSKVNGDIEVTCHHSATSWKLSCVDGEWQGQEGHCPSVDAGNKEEQSMLSWIKNNTGYSLGLLGLVTLGCAVLIFVGGFLGYVTCFYITRKHRQSQPISDPMVDSYTLKTMGTLKKPVYVGTYQRPGNYQLPTPAQGGTMRRNTDYQRMNPIDPETVSHHSYVLYDHVPKPLPPIPIDEPKRHIYETPLRPDQQ